MMRFQDLALHPAALSLSADEISEFHLARILLLLRLCGRKDRISGLTKFAKLDFFVRYPEFFERARDHVEAQPIQAAPSYVREKSIESSMVRHHYGPWDKRYYQLFARLSATGLISVRTADRTYNIELTDLGRRYANRLCKEPAFADLTHHMKDVSKVFGGRNGTWLKNLIYETFEEEVSIKSLGESI